MSNWLIVAAVAFAALGGNANAQCRSDADCRAGRVCLGGACSAPTCTMDVECPADQVCVSGTCVVLAAATASSPSPPLAPAPQPRLGDSSPRQPAGPPLSNAAVSSDAQVSPSPLGPGFFLQAGINVCVDGSATDCPFSDDPGFGFAGGFFWRIFDYLGVDAQTYFGMAEAGMPDLVYVAGLLVGPRLYVPVAGVLDLQAGLGLGYGHYEIRTKGFGSTWSETTTGYAHGFSLGLKFGAEYRVNPILSVGTMFQFVFPFFDEGCGPPIAGIDGCTRVDRDRSFYWMQWGVQGTVYFSP
jgi:hypothetical protein